MKLPEIGTRYHVWTDQPAPIVEVSQFGRYMEPDFVVEAALSEDETEINVFDIGETFARPASQIRAKQMGAGA